MVSHRTRRAIGARLRPIAAHAIGAALLLLGAAAPAHAHPHIIADVGLELIYDDQGRIAAVRESWAYDAFYSSLARRMADTDRDGKMSDAERVAFGNDQIKALAEFGYFTKLFSGEAAVALALPTDHELVETANDRLTLRFTLPLQTPVQTKDYRIEIFDPQFFAYFTTKDSRNIVFTGAAGHCSPSVTTPQPIDLKNTASVPAALWKAIDGSAADGRQFINSVVVACQ